MSACILRRYKGSLAKFRDTGEASEYAIPALRWAAEKEILLGNQKNDLNPTDIANRVEVATKFLHFDKLMK